MIRRFQANLERWQKKRELVLSVPIECVDSNGSRWTQYYKKEDSYARIDYFFRSPGWTEPRNVSWQIFRKPDCYEWSDHHMIWVDMTIP